MSRALGRQATACGRGDHEQSIKGLAPGRGKRDEAGIRPIMGHGADLGSELAADRALIESLAGRCEAERDPARRRALAKRLAAAVQEHLALAATYLAEAVREYVPSGGAAALSAERVRDRVNEALGRVAKLNGSGEAAAAATESDRVVCELAARSRGLLEVERTQLLPALENAVTWHVLEDLGEKVRAGRH